MTSPILLFLRYAVDVGKSNPNTIFFSGKTSRNTINNPDQQTRDNLYKQSLHLPPFSLRAHKGRSGQLTLFIT